MHWIPDEAREALRGDHTPGCRATAWYDGRITEQDLEVISCTERQAYGGEDVRVTIDATVADADGRLAPVKVTDPLSPYGQQLDVRATVGWGDEEILSVPVGRFRIQKPAPTGRWRLYEAPSESVVTEQTGWVFASPETVLDAQGYAAFSVATSLSGGRVAAAWSSGDRHISQLPARTRLSVRDAAGVWGAPVTYPYNQSPAGLAARPNSDRLALLTIDTATGTRVGKVSITTDGGVTWPVSGRTVEYGGTGWRFPSCLAWFDDGTADGIMISASYSAEGVRVVKSTDEGQTWTPVVQWSDMTFPLDNETTVTPLTATHWLAFTRHNDADHDEHWTWARETLDAGVTWSDPWKAVPVSGGMPGVTKLADGSLIMPIRHTTLDSFADGDAYWEWAWSADNARTWQRYNPDWPGLMMYGQFVEVGPSEVLLVGSTQPTTASISNCRTWARPITYGTRTTRTTLDRWYPTPGVVPLTAEDLQLSLVKSEIVGLMQPAAGATVAGEVARLCAGLVPVSGLPAVTVPKQGVYEEERHRTVKTLLALAGQVPAPTRGGSLTGRSAQRKTFPDLVVSPTAGNWIDAAVYPDDDGVVNVVQTSGEGTDAAQLIRGLAREVSGPLRWDGPMGPISLRHSSPFYTTTAAANAGAATMLAKRRAARELRVEAVMTYDPTVDCLDTHRIWLAPGLEPLGLVVGLSRDLVKGGPMSVTYTIPRDTVENWIRP